MGIGSNRSRTGKPATLCELRTRMRDLDQSSRITIPASGFCKCRMKRPDRRAHSIPSSYGKFSSCVAGGNHRREIKVLPPNPRSGRSGLTAKRTPASVLLRSRLCASPRCVPRTRAGRWERPGRRRRRRRPAAMNGPLAGASLSAREARACCGSRDGDGAGGKCAGGPKQEASHPQERACARDRVRHS